MTRKQGNQPIGPLDFPVVIVEQFADGDNVDLGRMTRNHLSRRIDERATTKAGATMSTHRHR